MRRIYLRLRRAAWHAGLVPKFGYRQRSYSQEGEDRVLARYFAGRGDGFFVDVGAHHPHRFSNTQLFYDRGWRGINVDAMPGSMRAFGRARPRDLNLEVGVGLTGGSGKFFVFEERALNTFDAELAERYAQASKLRGTIDVPVMRLDSLFDQHLPGGTKIDLMSVDVEGRDLDVLQSNDWSRYRPEILLVEALSKTIEDLAHDPVARFLGGVGYVALAKTMNTLIFRDGSVLTKDMAGKEPVGGTLSSAG
jgi:FkbM family methyltransferase